MDWRRRRRRRKRETTVRKMEEKEEEEEGVRGDSLEDYYGIKLEHHT